MYKGISLASRVLALCWLLAATIAADADGPANWPQFRGPEARGVAAGTGLPVRWSATENVAWKQRSRAGDGPRPLPGGTACL